MKTKGKGRGIKKAKSERQKKTFKRAYLTKAQAARRLQITNAEFERLVILKGIYPREPKRFDGSSGKDKTYFFAKDVLWLEREPLLQKMREYSTYRKKLTKLRGRRATYDAKIFEKQHKPQYSLSTIIKERYPTFLDALRDCDDALTHIFLYAALPPRVASDSTIEGHTFLTSAMSEQCKQVRDRWVRYITSTQSMKKNFISIKGIYYQAKVMGETITWQCPYEFTSKPPKDVVYRVLISFLELYLQQMRFILFKLEHDQKVEMERQEEADEDVAAEDAENFPLSEEEQKAMEKHKKHIELFKGLTFYVSREVPKLHIKFVVECFGGTVASEMAKGVSHCIMDRPKLPPGETQQVGVEYVQPQWLFDCVNAKGLLPVEEYMLGKKLPPHVSPFRISIADDEEENQELSRAVAEDRRIQLDDVPDRVHEIRRMLNPAYNKANPTADVHLSDEDEDDEAAQDQEDADESSFEEDEESSFDVEAGVKESITRSTASKKRLQKQLEVGDNKPTEPEVAEKKRQKLAAKKAARSTQPEDQKKKRKLEELAAKQEADKEFKEAVMPTKARKLYKSMKFGIAKRKKQLSELEERREMVRSGDASYDTKTKSLKLSKKSKK